MSKEAIEKLKDYCKWCNAQGGQCQLNLDGCAVGDALAILKEQPPAGELEILNHPHLESANCPTYHDGCHCTVETLIHNIKRAAKAEANRKEAGKALEMCERARACGQIEKIDKIILQAAIKANKEGFKK